MEENAGKTAGAEPLISVIVSVHNGQEYLAGCVESIEGQTWRALEVILVNDGSTDRTADICRELEKKYDNITVIEMEDRGVSAGRNVGLARMQGEYVTFVDADDRIHPGMIELLYRNLEDTGSDVSGCRFFSWQAQEEWEMGALRAREGEGRLCAFSRKEFVLQGILKNDTRCWSKLYRRECLQKVRFREGLTIGEDMLFLVDMLPYVKKTVSADFEGYGYFRNPKGAMNRQFRPSYMDQIACWKLAREEICKGSISRELDAREKEAAEEILSARLMTGIMLTVGKLSALSGRARRENKEYVKTCCLELKKCLAAGRGMRYLERGYRCKVRMFSAMPGIYVWLYGAGRRLKGERG